QPQAPTDTSTEVSLVPIDQVAVSCSDVESKLKQAVPLQQTQSPNDTVVSETIVPEEQVAQFDSSAPMDIAVSQPQLIAARTETTHNTTTVSDTVLVSIQKRETLETEVKTVSETEDQTTLVTEVSHADSTAQMAVVASNAVLPHIDQPAVV